MYIGAREYSYSVGGTIHSKYTNQKSKIISIETAAEMTGISVDKLKPLLQESKVSSIIMDDDGTLGYVDYEVQYWFDEIYNRQTKKRSWKKAWDYLRDLRLIDRTSLIEKLKQRHDQEWTPIQRRTNRFNQSHVNSYRRGVEDALSIVRRHGIETWDYVPCVGQIVGVGGCVGKITEIVKDVVVVEGVYYYADLTERDDEELSPASADHWTFYYKLNDIEASNVQPWNVLRRNDKTVVRWDYEKIPFKQSWLEISNEVQ